MLLKLEILCGQPTAVPDALGIRQFQPATGNLYLRVRKSKISEFLEQASSWREMDLCQSCFCSAGDKYGPDRAWRLRGPIQRRRRCLCSYGDVSTLNRRGFSGSLHHVLLSVEDYRGRTLTHFKDPTAEARAELERQKRRLVNEASDVAHETLCQLKHEIDKLLQYLVDRSYEDSADRIAPQLAEANRLVELNQQRIEGYRRVDAETRAAIAAIERPILRPEETLALG